MSPKAATEPVIEWTIANLDAPSAHALAVLADLLIDMAEEPVGGLAEFEREDAEMDSPAGRSDLPTGPWKCPRAMKAGFVPAVRDGHKPVKKNAPTKDQRPFRRAAEGMPAAMAGDEPNESGERFAGGETD